MTAEQKREQLLRKLKEAGVKAPAAMYPKSELWSVNTTPEDMFDRMNAHLMELAQLKAYEDGELTSFVTR